MVLKEQAQVNRQIFKETMLQKKDELKKILQKPFVEDKQPDIASTQIKKSQNDQPSSQLLENDKSLKFKHRMERRMHMKKFMRDPLAAGHRPMFGQGPMHEQ